LRCGEDVVPCALRSERDPGCSSDERFLPLWLGEDWLLRSLGFACVFDERPCSGDCALFSELLWPACEARSELLCPLVDRDGDCICELDGALMPRSCEPEFWELDCAIANALVPASSAAVSATLCTYLNDI
jgi:hypothetical protein